MEAISMGSVGSVFLQDSTLHRIGILGSRSQLGFRVQCMGDLHDVLSSIPKFNSCRVSNFIPLLAAAIISAEKNKQEMEETLCRSSIQMKRGTLIEDDLVFRQTFVIRSYEVGYDRTASIETLINLFQETALNHAGQSDSVGDGLGTTHAMMRHGLIWVVTRMHIEVDRYPIWGDVVEIDSWIDGLGRNFIRRDFLVRDYATGETLCRATSTWAMMNKSTRRLSKVPEDVLREISPYYLNRHVMGEETCQKIVKLDDSAIHVRSNLVPKLHDIDMNQHVNNVKYIGWVLESVPQALLVAHELMSMTLEYRRECAASDIVTSLTTPYPCSSSEPKKASHATAGDQMELAPPDSVNLLVENVQYAHLLRMQSDGSEILRGRTVWRSKQRFSSNTCLIK